MKDLHNAVRTAIAIAPVAAGTTGTGQVGKIIDTLGYGGVEFVLSVGAVTATGATIVPTLKEGDVTGTMTAVAAADILGTIALATVGQQATARTSGVGKNVTTRLGYRGSKRYVQLGMYSTATAGPIVSATALLHSPSVAPTANP